MRSWIETVEASDSVAVRAAVELWTDLIRAGWRLTILHRYGSPPTLRAFGYLPDDPVPRPDFGYPPHTAPQLRLPV